MSPTKRTTCDVAAFTGKGCQRHGALAHRVEIDGKIDIVWLCEWCSREHQSTKV